MDTDRIIINNYDLSTTQTTQTEDILGYTVIKAPSGPITPVLVSDVDTFDSIFGKISSKYPDLYEARTFVNNYPLYVSAPYDTTSSKIPVAYITNKGVFAAAKKVNYTQDVEKLNLRIYDNEVAGITNVVPEYVSPIGDGTAPDSILLQADIRYPFSGLGVATTDVSNTIGYSNCGTSDKPSTDKSYIRISTGMTYDQVVEVIKSNAVAVTASDDEDEDTSVTTGKFYIKGLPIDSRKSTVTQGKVTSSELEIECNVVKTSKSDTNSMSVIFYSYFGKTASGENKYVIGELRTENDEIPKTGSKDLTVICIGELSLNGGATINGSPIGTVPELFQTYINSFLETEASRAKLSAYWGMLIDVDNIYATIYPKYLSDNITTIEFSAFNKNTGYVPTSYSSRNRYEVTVSSTTSDYNSTSNNFEFLFSLLATDKNSSGALGITSGGNTSYNYQNFIGVYVIKAFSSTDILENTTISCYPPVTLRGGERGLDIFEDDKYTAYNIGWNEAKSEEFGDVDIFFESCPAHEYTGDVSTIPSSTDSRFFSLANTHKLAGYIYNVSVAPTTLEESRTYPPQLSYGSNYWNICNIAVVTSNDELLNSSMTGARSVMQANIIKYGYGGVAPMFLNSTISGVPVGGNLKDIIPVVERLKYRYNKSAQTTLDSLNFNPVVLDNNYGMLITGQKTGKSGELTDWSYIGHVSSFLNFQKEVKRDVMIPQIGKPNNEYYRALRKSQCETILRKRLVGANKIWAAGIVDTSTATGVNDTQALLARKFVINVTVKVDIYSEKVELNFTNVAQDVEIATN